MDSSWRDLFVGFLKLFPCNKTMEAGVEYLFIRTGEFSPPLCTNQSTSRNHSWFLKHWYRLGFFHKKKFERHFFYRLILNLNNSLCIYIINDEPTTNSEYFYHEIEPSSYTRSLSFPPTDSRCPSRVYNISVGGSSFAVNGIITSFQQVCNISISEVPSCPIKQVSKPSVLGILNLFQLSLWEDLLPGIFVWPSAPAPISKETAIVLLYF